MTDGDHMAKQPTPNQRLTQLGFSPPVWVEGAPSLLDIFPAARQCGVYVLHFPDGWKYVGQSVAVDRRFLQHLANFDDIRAISFLAVRREALDGAEQSVVESLEALGVRLRNIKLVSFVSPTTRLSEILPISEQQRWLTDLTYSIADGPRSAGDGQRSRTEARFRRWAGTCDVDAIVRFPARYLAVAIPAPHRTEQSYWSLSCLLSPQRSSVKYRYRVNINMQEVLCILEDEFGLAAYFQVAASPLRDAYGGSFRSCPVQNAEIDELPQSRYKPGGADQLRLFAPDLATGAALLDIDPVRLATRRFNLSLMRKGRCFWWRSHCFQLADACL